MASEKLTKDSTLQLCGVAPQGKADIRYRYLKKRDSEKETKGMTGSVLH